MEIITSVYSPDDYVYGYPASEHEQIIRCEDCTHYEYKKRSYCWYFADYEGTPAEVEPYGFCAWAKRKVVD